VLLAYQIGFDLYESATQDFLQRVLTALRKTPQLPPATEKPPDDRCVLLYQRRYSPARIEFKAAELCFKAVKFGTPSYLKIMSQSYEPVCSLRYSSIDLLIVPRTATIFARRCFSVAGPQI